MELFKKIAAFVLAIVLVAVMAGLFLKLLGIAFKILLEFVFIVLIIIIALPIYVIIKKKFFN